MVSRERGADRATGVTGSRLNPDIFEAPVAPDLTVGDAVKRHATCETEIPASGFGCECTRKPEYHFFRHRLDRSSQIHIALRQRRFDFPRRAAEQLLEFRV